MRASLDLLFIIDPIFSALLLLPLAMMLLFKNHVRLLGIASLLLMGIYLTTTLILHEKAVTLTRQHHPEAGHVHALPQPFSPFRWMLVASYPLKESRTVVDFLPAFSGSAALFPDSLVSQFAYSHTTSAILWQELPAMRGVMRRIMVIPIGWLSRRSSSRRAPGAAGRAGRRCSRARCGGPGRWPRGGRGRCR